MSEITCTTAKAIALFPPFAVDLCRRKALARCTKSRLRCSHPDCLGRPSVDGDADDNDGDDDGDEDEDDEAFFDSDEERSASEYRFFHSGASLLTGRLVRQVWLKSRALQERTAYLIKAESIRR
jgi:hypothetical protein